MTATRRTLRLLTVGLAAFGAAAAPARADIVLSELIVDLRSGERNRQDVEIWNNGEERAFVAIEPREIVNAGQANEAGREELDPEKLGILVAPARLILEPGQRKLMRIAALGSDGGRERVYRITVKPVAGRLSSEESGLKLLVGYDLLALVRPRAAKPSVSGARSGDKLTLRNDGNVSVELIQGRQCDASGANCRELPRKRLYAGAQWTQTLPLSGPADYVVRSPAGQQRTRF